MNRRSFIKIGLAASGTLLATNGLPLFALAETDIFPVKGLEGLLTDPEFNSGTFYRGNDACVEVAPDIFAANIREMKKDIGQKVKLCIVMKSDAYAHGVENLMAEALRAEPAYIGMTGNKDIRKAIRYMDKSETRTRILRIAPATFYEAAEAALKNWPIEELIGSLSQAKALSRIATWVSEKRGEKQVIPVHVNINTGMGRMGFQRVEDIRKAISLPSLKLRGIMTHYANAYDPDLKHREELTRKQLDIFDDVVAKLKPPKNVIIHTANSGATLCFPWSRRNMVRIGGALYGDIPKEMNPDSRYQRVMTAFKSKVVWVMNKIPPNTPVGYESVYHTPPDLESTLATVKVGYNNGLPSWAYKKGTQVLIRGQKFPVVGKTSMNMVVVDVTKQQSKDKISFEDEALFFGRQGNQEISIEDIEQTTSIPGCELTLMIGNTNPRIVVRK
ncbi:MAG: alanine racemase [Desulfovibrio sp. S3730MH75]|nr:MAG: alanine racemase [Desulfovibrio sp. S3730MH75]